VGEGVAEGAIGEEKIVDAGLGEDVTEFGRVGGVGERGTPKAGWGTELATQFETFEESAPGGIDGGGIGFP